MTAPHHSPPGVYATFELNDYAETLEWILRKPHLVPPALLPGLEQWRADVMAVQESRQKEPTCAS
jgi:hypothetical protein